MISALRVEEGRLWQTLQEAARFGATPNGGVRRLSLTAEDTQARDSFRCFSSEAGYELRTDALGSMFAIRPGRDPSRPYVGVGAHLDTQPEGGRFDGILGVCAAIEVARTLDDAAIKTDACLCLVNWTNEEGTRFQPWMMTSAVDTGRLSLETALAARDGNGIMVAEALRAIDYQTPSGEGVLFGAFLELHIEQGPLLESEDAAIGIVEGAYGLCWFDGVVEGVASHAGATPMHLRRDALTAFSELALAVETVSASLAPATVSTVGTEAVGNASWNTVAGEIRFSIDLRASDADAAQVFDLRVRRSAREIAERRGVEIRLDTIFRQPAVTFDVRLAALASSAARQLEFTSRPNVSGAGHDSCNLAAVAPTTIIFIPCRAGISHNEREWATKEDCSAGANVLLHTALSIAEAVH